MYLENVPPRWLIKILERYVNNLNEYNENEIHRHFWFQCIFFIFFNEIKSNELKFNVSKKYNSGFDLLDELNDKNLDKFVGQLLNDLSKINKDIFEKLMSLSKGKVIEMENKYYIFGINNFPTKIFWDLWLIFVQRTGFEPINKMNFSPTKIFFQEYMEDFYSRQRYD